MESIPGLLKSLKILFLAGQVQQPYSYLFLAPLECLKIPALKVAQSSTQFQGPREYSFTSSSDWSFLLKIACVRPCLKNFPPIKSLPLYLQATFSNVRFHLISISTYSLYVMAACVATFSFAQLATGKSLGRSKPAT